MSSPDVSPSGASGTSLYIHFPWCLKKCPYCDFNSHKMDKESVPHQGYADAIIDELTWRKDSGTHVGPLTSIFFGGGTPSLWDPLAIERVINRVAALWPVAEDLEITAECNPSSLDVARSHALKNAGINRLSVGVQSLDDRELEYFGRLHSGVEALKSLDGALATGLRVSADLMFGAPVRTPEEWVKDVIQLTALGLGHLSVYALTIESGTQFGYLHQKKRLPLMAEDGVAQSYTLAEQALTQRGFLHYEVSNYALPGQESIHNAHYWRGGDYLGVGAGALGCLRQSRSEWVRYRNQSQPEQYLALAKEPRALVEWSETIGTKERLSEQLMLGLRTLEGANVQTVLNDTQFDLREPKTDRAKRRFQSGEARISGDYLVVPPENWLNLDSIATDLMQW